VLEWPLSVVGEKRGGEGQRSAGPAAETSAGAQRATYQRMTDVPFALAESM
jgi:hypothetical protein